MMKDASYHYDIQESGNSNNIFGQNLEDTPLGEKVRQNLITNNKDAIVNEIPREHSHIQDSNDKVLRMKHDQSILLNKAFALTSKNTILKNVKF